MQDKEVIGLQAYRLKLSMRAPQKRSLLRGVREQLQQSNSTVASKQPKTLADLKEKYMSLLNLQKDTERKTAHFSQSVDFSQKRPSIAQRSIANVFSKSSRSVSHHQSSERSIEVQIEEPPFTLDGTRQKQPIVPPLRLKCLPPRPPPDPNPSLSIRTHVSHSPSKVKTNSNKFKDRSTLPPQSARSAHPMVTPGSAGLQIPFSNTLKSDVAKNPYLDDSLPPTLTRHQNPPQNKLIRASTETTQGLCGPTARQFRERTYSQIEEQPAVVLQIPMTERSSLGTISVSPKSGSPANNEVIKLTNSLQEMRAAYESLQKQMQKERETSRQSFLIDSPPPKFPSKPLSPKSLQQQYDKLRSTFENMRIKLAKVEGELSKLGKVTGQIHTLRTVLNRLVVGIGKGPAKYTPAYLEAVGALENMCSPRKLGYDEFNIHPDMKVLCSEIYSLFETTRALQIALDKTHPLI